MENAKQMAINLVDSHYKKITSIADDDAAYKQAKEHALITCDLILDNTNNLFVRENFLMYQEVYEEIKKL